MVAVRAAILSAVAVVMISIAVLFEIEEIAKATAGTWSKHDWKIGGKLREGQVFSLYQLWQNMMARETLGEYSRAWRLEKKSCWGRRSNWAEESWRDKFEVGLPVCEGSRVGARHVGMRDAILEEGTLRAATIEAGQRPQPHSGAIRKLQLRAC